MPGTCWGLKNVVPICPECHQNLTFLCTWNFRDRWGYTAVQTYECPSHGPIFLTLDPAVRPAIINLRDAASDDGDRDALITARRTPKPTLNADAIAVPEPDSE